MAVFAPLKPRLDIGVFMLAINTNENALVVLNRGQKIVQIVLALSRRPHGIGGGSLVLDFHTWNAVP